MASIPPPAGRARLRRAAVLALPVAAILVPTAVPDGGGHAAAQEAPVVEFVRPTAEAPYSEVVRVGHTLYVSGTLGLLPEGGLVPGGIQPETRQTLENIRSAIARFGATMDDLVKCTVFLADVAEWSALNEVYVTFFPGNRPARSAVGVAGLPLDARVEIECIGVIR
jgi:2-iminobutanoate/2-iminopropanoate deaminase